MGVQKRVVVYDDERLAELGHNLRKLRQQEVAIKRAITELEAEQNAYLATLPSPVEQESEPLRRQFYAVFDAAMKQTDPHVLRGVYGMCMQHHNITHRWRSEFGEVMGVAFRRRLDEIGGVPAVMEAIEQEAEIAKVRWSLIVCGDRNWPLARKDVIRARLAKFPDTTLVIHGGNGYRNPDGKITRGADMLADGVVKKLGWRSPMVFPYIGALGKAGGPVRNQQMLAELVRRRDENGDEIMVIGFHPNLAQSSGTVNMIGLAQKAGVAWEVVP